MFMTIEPSSGVPIYEQIVRQIKFAVAEGRMVPGQLVPSVRDFAKQLAVNPNTIQRAFQQLQSEQVLEVLRGKGLLVCAGAVGPCRAQRIQIITQQLSQVVQEGLSAGLVPDDLRAVFESSLLTHSKRDVQPTAYPETAKPQPSPGSVAERQAESPIEPGTG